MQKLKFESGSIIRSVLFRHSGKMILLTAALFISLPVHAQQKYALLIGLNDYLYVTQGLEMLNYTDEDVSALKEVLTRQGYKVTSLLNDEAKREDIVEQLSRYAFIIKPKDTFLVYFSGHGVQNTVINKKSYWMTYDADIDALDVNGMRLSHLLDYIQDIKADFKLVLLDHCYSGEIVSDEHLLASGEPIPRGEGGDSLSLSRGSLPIGEFESEINKRKGMVILTASKGAALEMAELNHGVFTHVLLEAMETDSADNNNDQALSVSELQNYLDRKVPVVSNHQQQVVDFSIGTGMSALSIIDHLPEDNIDDAAIRKTTYTTRLNTWYDRSWIKLPTKIYCEKIIDLWQASLAASTELGVEDQNTFTRIADMIEFENEGQSEQASASSLETYVKFKSSQP